MSNLLLPLQIDTPSSRGVMRASKWLKHQVLLDTSEIESLLAELGAFEIFVVSEPVVAEAIKIAPHDFLQTYAEYVQALKNGVLPDERKVRRYFSSVFTKSADALYAMPVGQDRYLVKTVKPVIQLQVHHFFVSEVDGKFHPMVLGKESITWGIQFSYPQIFQSPTTFDYAKVDDSSEFPNTELFKRLIKWLRNHTMPTPFIHGGKRSNVPIRLGKMCLDWINSHPGLKAQGVAVAR